MNGMEMFLLRRRLRRAGFAVYQFRYPSVTRGLRHNLELLNQFVARVPGNEIHFLGHSTGAVLMERYLRQSTDPRLGRVVATGPPFNGSWAARQAVRLPFQRHWLGSLAREILIEHTTQKWTLPRPLAIFAGDRSFGVGSLLGKFPGPNDGVVGVDETRLEGAELHVVHNLTHTGLILSPTVSRQIVDFLLGEGKPDSG
jgi:pimeloyl-ACP methyl ester carboxylesterase